METVEQRLEPSETDRVGKDKVATKPGSARKGESRPKNQQPDRAQVAEKSSSAPESKNEKQVTNTSQDTAVKIEPAPQTDAPATQAITNGKFEVSFAQKVKAGAAATKTTTVVTKDEVLGNLRVEKEEPRSVELEGIKVLFLVVEVSADRARTLRKCFV